MTPKVLDSEKASSIINRIRNTKSRKLTLHKPVIELVEGRKTVLSLSSGKNELGKIRVKTSREAEKLSRSQSIDLRITFDSNRNEQLVADFS